MIPVIFVVQMLTKYNNFIMETKIMFLISHHQFCSMAVHHVPLSHHRFCSLAVPTLKASSQILDSHYHY